ncbi:hypothetical protein ABOM_000730 [Aspergillus bombycis]|uniref:Secreted protein n=1 Tax=Aspergillus bombycis TaxID=109264 RepID=A0A1F8AGX5_9EURO|nr:hypothetical protein ABOM_000730 [Aspergillus bombycis]OGM50947.1 hypothetical protein ABOM_000730 [Aspergillus bombycis]
MHFAALIAATMALAGSATAQCHAGGTADCKPGFNYCAKTLNDRGDANSAIGDALRASGHEVKAGLPGTWDNLIFHCNDDYTLKLVEQCNGSFCVDGGLNKNDYCGEKWSPF